MGGTCSKGGGGSLAGGGGRSIDSEGNKKKSKKEKKIATPKAIEAPPPQPKQPPPPHAVDSSPDKKNQKNDEAPSFKSLRYHVTDVTAVATPVGTHAESSEAATRKEVEHIIKRMYKLIDVLIKKDLCRDCFDMWTEQLRMQLSDIMRASDVEENGLNKMQKALANIQKQMEASTKDCSQCPNPVCTQPHIKAESWRSQIRMAMVTVNAEAVEDYLKHEQTPPELDE